MTAQSCHCKKAQHRSLTKPPAASYIVATTIIETQKPKTTNQKNIFTWEIQPKQVKA
jgi:hypothetical protein